MSRQFGRAAKRATQKAENTGSKQNRAVILASVVSEENSSDPITMQYEELSERQRRGWTMFKRSQRHAGMLFFGQGNSVHWASASEAMKIYEVSRQLTNERGTLTIKYRCRCEDFKKYGTYDCKHIFAEKLRRGEVIVEGRPAKAALHEKAKRGLARKRYGFDGRCIRSVQRSARQKMPARIPALLSSLQRSFDLNVDTLVIPRRDQKYPGGSPGTALSTQALALVAKVAHGKSADEMQHIYQGMIDEGTLKRRNAPSGGALTDWFNDERVTPVLQEFLRLSSVPFVEREIGAIIDSTKVSQLMTAHYKEVQYGSDVREKANWMKCHAIIGVESLIVMAVEFSGSINDHDENSNAHDINFLRPLVERSLRSFSLEYLLADKAYLSASGLDWLWAYGLKAAIPVKKKWYRDENKEYSEAIRSLLEWFDRNNNRDFYEVYRCRPKIENALFASQTACARLLLVTRPKAQTELRKTVHSVDQ